MEYQQITLEWRKRTTYQMELKMKPKSLIRKTDKSLYDLLTK